MRSSSDTDQVSVCGWLGFVLSKVLCGDFLGRLAVTDDGQQAEKQQSAEHPGALHGAGGAEGGGRRAEVPAGGSGSGLEEQRSTGESPSTHRTCSSLILTHSPAREESLRSCQGG